MCVPVLLIAIASCPHLGAGAVSTRLPPHACSAGSGGSGKLGDCGAVLGRHALGEQHRKGRLSPLDSSQVAGADAQTRCGFAKG